MATHEVDQKLLAHLARGYARRQPKLSSTLFQILGLSIMLGPRLVTARRMREDELEALDHASRRRLLEEIVWLTRAGLELVVQHLAPELTESSEPKLKIFAAKLRASFYHVLCLFHNDPPITALANSVLAFYNAQARGQPTSPLTARSGNGRSPPSSGKSTSKGKQRASPRTSENKENSPPSPQPDRRGVRESMLSEASMVTNPWSNLSPQPPPGLSAMPDVPTDVHFLLPRIDYLPAAQGSFNEASKVAMQLLPASAPLRLSVALEQCAFLWDCMHDHEGSRKLARTTIRDVYRTDAGLTDEEFDDATTIVGTLGRMMRRKSQEGTPRFGIATPPAPANAQSSTRPSKATPPLPPKPASDEHGMRTKPLSTGNVARKAQRVAQSSPKSATASIEQSAPTTPPQRIQAQPTGQSSSSGRGAAAKQSPARGSPSRQSPPRQSPSSSSGMFQILRRPVPGSSTSPGRSNTSPTGSAARSSTAPTTNSTPRPAPNSPQRSSKRAGSDTESPTRKQRSRRKGN